MHAHAATHSLLGLGGAATAALGSAADYAFNIPHSGAPEPHARAHPAHVHAHDEAAAEETESESWLRHSGIGQLYRGLSVRMGAGAIVFVLALMSGSDEADAGWAEL